jgi:hypothetical protein
MSGMTEEQAIRTEILPSPRWISASPLASPSLAPLTQLEPRQRRLVRHCLSPGYADQLAFGESE